MKFYALYLPQFHVIEENNNWWGEGFTEWVNVKNAKPLFKGHQQPKVPLENNYYDLLNKKTVQWQTEIMKKYNIDGMIYYHYYFCGNKLLEKPAENLLRWDDIEQPFFFCWANHSWYRSWEGSKELLIEQKYGDKNEWKMHFDYLLPFFLDKRYEKHNNKPVFMIFDTNFPEMKDMFSYWDLLCKEAGFDGIYIIETCIKKEECEKDYGVKEYESRKYYREPIVGKEFYYSSIKYKVEWFRVFFRKLFFSKILKKPRPLVFDGNRIYSYMLKEKKDDTILHGLFFSWDNTPRHGNRGYIISEPKKEIVMKYLDSINDSDYVIINAWNEWAEGMMLEPTENEQYKYLEWINEWVVNQKVT